MTNPKCKICGSKNTILHYNNYPGYVDEYSYNIFHCNSCNTNFVEPDELLQDIYEKIYSVDQVEGYEQYAEIARQIKYESSPLKFLSCVFSTYFSVYDFLKNKSSLKILEVGCGHGYLTYALNNSGFDATGLDVSSKAIESAKSNFGDKFICADLTSYVLSSNEKYDLVIATEVIEHVNEPVQFIENCLNLLKPGGKILITTPSKDFFVQKAIWFTDLPPVHLFWLSKNSFDAIADKLKLKLEFSSFRNYYPKKENRLVRYLRYRNEYIQKPVLNSKFLPLEGRKMIESSSRKLVKKFLFDFSAVRFICNFIYNYTLEKDMTLGVIISKK